MRLAMDNNPYHFKNLVSIYEEYLNLIVSKVKGYKILILDDETKGIISLIFSHSYILEKEIFLTLNFNDTSLFEDINNKNTKFDFKNDKIRNLKHLKAIFLLRPSHTNILKLIRELRAPNFCEYYIFFTNVLADKYIEKLAKADEFEMIKNIIEYYTDVFVLHDYLFTLNIDFTAFLYRNKNNRFMQKVVESRRWESQKLIQKHGKLAIGDIKKQEQIYSTYDLEQNKNENEEEDEEGYHEEQWSEFILFEKQVVERIVDGLFSILCCIKQCPLMIYNQHSSVCKYIIDLLKEKVGKYKFLFTPVLDSYGQYNNEIAKKKLQQMESDKANYQFNNLLYQTGGGLMDPGSIIGTSPGSTNNNSVNALSESSNNFCVFLMLDRREDPITPLLTQWTYQAMLHELIGIENNKIDLENDNNNIDTKTVMSCNYDEFYNEHLFDNFGDLGKAVKDYVDVYQEETTKKTKLESIDDIQKFIDLYPNYKKLSGNVTKHVNILHKFSRIVEKRQLFYISELEQSIAIYHKKNEHFKQVIETIKNYNYSNYDVLRLSLLYALKYEDEEHIKEIKNELSKRNIDKDQISLIDALLIYSNEQTRNNQLFKEQTFLNFAKTTISRTIKGTSNVFTLHKSYLYYIVDDIIKSKLNTQIYSSMPLFNTNTTPISPINKKPSSIVIFFIGGTTYEEYKDIQYLSKKHNISILLGSTQIHNSQSFLADVLQLIKV